MDIEKKYVNDINKIFNYYLNKKAKIWNIDTDPFSTWKLFAQKLKENFVKEEFEFTKCIIKLSKHTTKEGAKRFHLFIGKKKVTPSNRCFENGWAYSSLRQFLQVGSLLGVILYNNLDKILDKVTFDLTPRILNLWEMPDNWLKFLFSAMKISITANNSFTCNFGFSFFYVLVCKYYKNKLNLFDKQLLFEWKSSRRKPQQAWYIHEDYAKDVDEKINKETYKSSTNIISKQHDNIEEVVTTLIKCINWIEKNNGEANGKSIDYKNEGKDDFYSKDDITMHNDKVLREAKRKVECRRINLKSKIIGKRASKLKQYSDLYYTPEHIPFIKNSEAAHIFQIKQINKGIQEYITSCNKENKRANDENKINELINKVDDINNGLIMDVGVHRAYDRGNFYINLKGEIIFQNDEKNFVRSLNIDKAFIKKNIFTKEMQSYLKQRGL